MSKIILDKMHKQNVCYTDDEQLKLWFRKNHIPKIAVCKFNDNPDYVHLDIYFIDRETLKKVKEWTTRDTHFM